MWKFNADREAALARAMFLCDQDGLQTERFYAENHSFFVFYPDALKKDLGSTHVIDVLNAGDVHGFETQPFMRTSGFQGIHVRIIADNPDLPDRMSPPMTPAALDKVIQAAPKVTPVKTDAELLAEEIESERIADAIFFPPVPDLTALAGDLADDIRNHPDIPKLVVMQRGNRLVVYNPKSDRLPGRVVIDAIPAEWWTRVKLTIESGTMPKTDGTGMDFYRLTVQAD